jgi:hypothetical protein
LCPVTLSDRSAKLNIILMDDAPLTGTPCPSAALSQSETVDEETF